MSEDVIPFVLPPVSEQGLIINRTGDQYASNIVYKGRRAKYISYSTAKISIDASGDWHGAIDVYEDGIVVGFTVAVNDEDMSVDYTIEGDNETEYSVHDMTMKETVLMARGMTFGEATSHIPDGTSRDVSGRPHAIKPFISRYKNTFTGTETNYELIKGTEFDKWIVLEYAPTIPLEHRRFFFNVHNNLETGSRMIHRITIDRIVFVEERPQPLLSADHVLEDPETVTKPTEEDTSAIARVMARRNRLAHEQEVMNQLELLRQQQAITDEEYRVRMEALKEESEAAERQETPQEEANIEEGGTPSSDVIATGDTDTGVLTQDQVFELAEAETEDSDNNIPTA